MALPETRPHAPDSRPSTPRLFSDDEFAFKDHKETDLRATIVEFANCLATTILGMIPERRSHHATLFSTERQVAAKYKNNFLVIFTIDKKTHGLVPLVIKLSDSNMDLSDERIKQIAKRQISAEKKARRADLDLYIVKACVISEDNLIEIYSTIFSGLASIFTQTVSCKAVQSFSAHSYYNDVTRSIIDRTIEMINSSLLIKIPSSEIF